ncbi:tegument protein UL14 [Equid alphaherpesvirus 4]|nr:tegument protein UL14 [Equid alphaherpesvirus 4]QYL35317.1 tegument protein UL14 [Equid alphaherpesvirus 4]QYL35394.1 tegument protein UL14 [Equid alphaherpesvirus 4]QYL35472.1 tegument protein UL14 [Equid alphaherpesvirus 4]
MSFSTQSRRRRLQLEEAYQREMIFKMRTLDLVREGVDKRNPAFVRAFTSAKEASLDLNRYMQAHSRVGRVEQNARALAQRVEAQAAVGEILDRHRRFLHKDFIDKFDSLEDSLVEREERLGDVLSDINCDGGSGEAGESEEWLGHEDEALLMRWMLEEAPRVSTKIAMDPHSPRLTCPVPKKAPKNARCEARGFGVENHPTQSTLHCSPETLADQRVTLDENMREYQTTNVEHHLTTKMGTNRSNQDTTAPALERQRLDVVRQREKSSGLPKKAPHGKTISGPASQEWLGGIPPLSDEELQVDMGIPTMNGPIYPDNLHRA